MTYVIEVTDGREVRVCEVTNLYDRYAQPTRDPAAAISGVIRLAPGQYLDFAVDSVEMFTVH